MILPRTRDSFDRSDAIALADLLGIDDPEIRAGAHARLGAEGFDTLLDDPRTLNALLTNPGVTVSPAVVFYVLIRHALLECNLTDRAMADYVTTMVLAFGQGNRAYRISEDSEDEFRYMVDMLGELREADSRAAFLLRSHMGNYALWLTGLFPDYIRRRVDHRGAPSLTYYEQVGSSGFRGAGESKEARDLGVDQLLGAVSRDFSVLRQALNLLADRHLWRAGGNPVERLLREVARTFPPD